ncbi:hypothetical protein DH2020_010057 [Rehmannia glutinosa]|uniref:Uncharacterized protein n=1 Tax=Rehmannia glutinosa TaxID=99300 RepID=A0ABR0XA11_REHGL
MAEKQPSKNDRKRERQPISVPFIWEEKPGTPKKDWKPTSPQMKKPLHHPSSSSSRSPSNGKKSPQTSFALTNTNGGQLQSPGSPASETESTTSSYATGTASLVGASFLEWLFPLLASNSSLPNKVGCGTKDPSQKTDLQGKELMHERNSSQVGRPLLTLGELIVMSRRRSCQRKVNKMHKQTSMDFVKRNAFGCFIFGSGNGITGWQTKLKRQLQLKLM